MGSNEVFGDVIECWRVGEVLLEREVFDDHRKRSFQVRVVQKGPTKTRSLHATGRLDRVSFSTEQR